MVQPASTPPIESQEWLLETNSDYREYINTRKAAKEQKKKALQELDQDLLGLQVNLKELARMNKPMTLRDFEILVLCVAAVTVTVLAIGSIFDTQLRNRLMSGASYASDFFSRKFFKINA